MSSKGEATREKIVAKAQSLILSRGFAGMSLDDVLQESELSKGAFFHHFSSKAELATAVLERYAANDLALFQDWSEQADRLSDDPLERVLIFLRLFEDYLNSLAGPFPGCIFGSYTYSTHQFSPEIHAYINKSLNDWTDLYELKFARLISVRKPVRPVTARELSEMIASIIEGGIIMGLATRDSDWLQRQSKQFRTYVELLFERPN